MGDRVVFVVVALSAGYRHAQPSHAGGCDTVNNVEVSILGIDEPSFIAGHYIAMETASNLLLNRGVRNEIASKLCDGELVERHVRIESMDHPLTPKPHVAKRIIVIAAGIAIAC